MVTVGVRLRTAMVIDPISNTVNKAALGDIFSAFDLDNNGHLDDKEMERFMAVLFQVARERGGCHTCMLA